MNFWIKYSPLIYTYYTRIFGLNKNQNKLLSIFVYLWSLFSVGVLCMFTLFFFGVIGIRICFMYMLLYFYLYIIFLIFYEIGYIYNDVWSVKKEKNPTYYVKNNFPRRFWIIQIIFRIIIGGILLIPLYLFFYKIFIEFLCLIFFMLIVFSIHNIIRNYSVNMYTFSILRICKVLIFIIIITNLVYIDGDLSDILIPILLFYVLDLYIEWFHYYNKRLGGINVDRLFGYSYVLVFIFCLLFFLLTQNKFFIVIPLVQLLPRFLWFLHRFPGSFSLKNDR